MKLWNLLAIAALLGTTVSAQASIVAIIDSGTDLNHQELKNKKWFNAKDVDDAVDNDDNGFIDDINGWNFAENNNKLFDKTLLGTFSPDVYKFFEIQTRIMKGEATPEDVTWIRQKQGDSKFLSELSVFGNFIHGTHVAGIAARGAEAAKIMGLKIIPTKVPTVGGGRFAKMVGAIHESADPDALIKTGLRFLASQQGKQLAPIGKYVGAQKARIANCSFGTSTGAAKRILAPLLEKILKRKPTEEELVSYSIFFVNEVVKAADALVSPAKNTLFVIAAGNDGMDNDRFPTSPANLKRDNTITVAATFDYKKLAGFSNYGAKMVEVAAPGVGIMSAIPGNEFLTVNGTSQAAPFVAGVAGMILDQNPALSNSDVKTILMSTSDLKGFLADKVASGGIVNPSRAVMAARLSNTMQLGDAIQAARVQVTDVSNGLFEKNASGFEGYVLPLPGLFH